MIFTRALTKSRIKVGLPGLFFSVSVERSDQKSVKKHKFVSQQLFLWQFDLRNQVKSLISKFYHEFYKILRRSEETKKVQKTIQKILIKLDLKEDFSC